MKRTGEILREAREAKGLSLNEIALSLKINSKVLSAIEEADAPRLPGKAFLRGFVQSYANYLRVNVEEVMRIYTEEMGPTKPTLLDSPISLRSPETNVLEAPSEAQLKHERSTANEPVVVPTPPRAAGRQKSDASIVQMEERSRARALFLSIVVALAIVLIFATKKVIDRYQRETVPSEVSVSSPLPNPETGTGPSNVVAPGTAAPAAPSTATSAIVAEHAATGPTAGAKLSGPALVPATPPETKAVEPRPVEAKIAEPKKVEAAKTETAKADVVKPEVAKPEVKTPEVKTAEVAEPAKKKKGKSLELIIEALDTVEVEYSTANGPPQKMTLQPETVHTIRSQNGIKVSISNGGAASLTLNGKDLGTAGDLGQAVKLNY